jgi:hypothetical protein
MPEEIDTPLTEEELALARKGEALIRASVADVEAPQSLREAIENDRARGAAREQQPFWRRRRGLVAAGASAVVLAGAAIALQAGQGSGNPSLSGVDAVAQLAPTEAAPATLGGDPPVLDVKVDRISFPDWQEKFGWKAVGRRDDELSGRTVTTVFYRNPKGERLGYAVVGGKALGESPAGREVERDGKTYHVADAGSSTVVTWTQQGQTCVIVAPAAVPQSKLVDLAASRNV